VRHVVIVELGAGAPRVFGPFRDWDRAARFAIRARGLPDVRTAMVNGLRDPSTRELHDAVLREGVSA